jgi:hypothetical protein
MATMCGICQQSIREGSTLGRIRVTEEDLQSEEAKKAKVKATRPGLYAACEDCVNALRPVIRGRLDVTEDQFTDDMMV